jgi:subtilisin
MSTHETNDLAALLRTLPPAPERWVRRAHRIPSAARRPRPFGRFLQTFGGSALVAHSAAEALEPSELPAWSLHPADVQRIRVRAEWPARADRDWAFGGATGEGVRVCVLDSGIDGDHPKVAGIEAAVAVVVGDDGEMRIEDDAEGDLCGHGTACASVIRSIAPQCELHSVRVLGEGFTGSGPAFLAGLRWALDQRFDVINMSLSTTKAEFGAQLRELADDAYFRRSLLISSAHNLPVESYPWRFASVISVGSHEEPDPLAFYFNPSPPVEFFARGVDVDVAWPGGGTMRCTGNSFAAPHVAALCALALAKHPELTAAQLKSLLYLTATNTGGT